VRALKDHPCFREYVCEFCGVVFYSDLGRKDFSKQETQYVIGQCHACSQGFYRFLVVLGTVNVEYDKYGRKDVYADALGFTGMGSLIPRTEPMAAFPTHAHTRDNPL